MTLERCYPSDSKNVLYVDVGPLQTGLDLIESWGWGAVVSVITQLSLGLKNTKENQTHFLWRAYFFCFQVEFSWFLVDLFLICPFTNHIVTKKELHLYEIRLLCIIHDLNFLFEALSSLIYGSFYVATLPKISFSVMSTITSTIR